MSILHGKVISYKDIKNLPTRESFLNKKIVNKVNESINNEDPIYFMPNAVTEKNIPDNPKNEFSKHKYKIILFGVFADGRSTTIVINNVIPYIYVKIPEKYSKKTGNRYKFKSIIEQRMIDCVDKYNNKLIDYMSIEIVKKNVFEGFNKTAYYLKISFYKSSYKKHRNKAINLFRNEGWETATDDAAFCKIFLRDRKLTIGTWLKLKKYRLEHKNQLFKDETIYNVSIDDIESCGDVRNNPLLAKDKTMIMGWDIECASKTGDLPLPSNKDDKLFMICITFQWYSYKTQLLRVNIVDSPVDSHSDFLSIVCKNEKELLKAFSRMIGLMTPEFIVGFNDGSFDWPWVVRRAWDHGVIEYMAQHMDRLSVEQHYYRNISYKQWEKTYKEDVYDASYSGDKLKTKYNAYLASVISNYNKEKVKIAGGNIDATPYSLQYNGYIPFDVRVIFMKLYPTAEKSSLNYFLEENGLKNKEDMPINKMFKIYWDMVKIKNNPDSDEQLNLLKEDMKKVSNYCVVDSQRCIELIRKRNVIPDYREIANVSFIHLYDALYRADSMKIKNIVIAEGQTRGYVFSSRPKKKRDDFKYPGAKVLEPKTGLYVPKLTLRERIEKYNEFIDKFGEDFDESYSYRNIPYINMLKIEDLGPKISALEKAIIKEKSPAVSLSKDEAKKVLQTAKIIYKKNWTRDTNNVFMKFLLEETKRPVTGIDFESLYPNQIMTHNMSPEYLLSYETCDYSYEKLKEEYEKAINAGYKLHHINFKYGDSEIQGWTIKHENIINIQNPTKNNNRFGIYPTVLKKLFDKRKILKKPKQYYEYLIEYFEKINDDITNNNKIVKYIKDNPDIIYVENWDELIDEESAFIYAKDKFCHLSFELAKKEVIKMKKLELITQLDTDEAIKILKHKFDHDDLGNKINDIDVNKIKSILDHKKDKITIDELEINFAYYDSKQKALKIMMNTLYGTAGDKKSSLYILTLAGGVTTAGRQTLELAINTCEEFGCNVVYGDTDSCYITIPEKFFREIDCAYYGGNMSKLEYWSEMITITLKEAHKINKKLNEIFYKKYNSKFLKTALEEVIGPAVFLSKKKYFGLPHQNVPNFNTDRKYFLRGIESVKRGTSTVLKKVYNEKIMKLALSIDNKKELIELAYDAIHYFYENDWDERDFIKTSIYKPKTIEEIQSGKGNSSVLEFVDRMSYRNIDVKPYERFKYVIVDKYSMDYDYRGRKRDLRVGEKMEFFDYAKKHNLVIDKDYYMGTFKSGYIMSQLGRVLVYYKEFYVKALSNDDDDIKDANDKMIDNAKRHLTEFIIKKGFRKTYRSIGPIKQKMFREIKSIINDELMKVTEMYIDKETCELVFMDWDMDTKKSFDKLHTKMESIAKRITKTFGADFIKEYINCHDKNTKSQNYKHLQRMFGDEYKICMRHYLNYKLKNTDAIEEEFRNIFDPLKIIIYEYRDTVQTMMIIMDNAIKPIIKKLYNPIYENKKDDNFNNIIKKTIDELLILSGTKVDILYNNLSELAKDFIYTLITNTSVAEVINKLNDIKYKLCSILCVYYQAVTISKELVIHNEMKYNILNTVYSNESFIETNKNIIINELCNKPLMS